MKDKWIKMYLDFADRLAQESHATRLKVGAVFVSSEGVMSTGINGLPAGRSNECEVYISEGATKKLVTKPEVSHAEEQLFGKLMRQGVSTIGGSLFLTHEPCINCARIIVNAGISEVWFRNSYSGSNPSGSYWIYNNNIPCRKESYASDL